MHDHDVLPTSFLVVVAARLLIPTVFYLIGAAVGVANVWAGLALTLLTPVLNFFAIFELDPYDRVSKACLWCFGKYIVRAKKSKNNEQVGNVNNSEKQGVSDDPSAADNKSMNNNQVSIEGASYQNSTIDINSSSGSSDKVVANEAQAINVEATQQKEQYHSIERFIGSDEYHILLTERVKGFADAVFAIVITIEVLQLKIHNAPHSNEELGTELLAMWPIYVSFIVSVILVSSQDMQCITNIFC